MPEVFKAKFDCKSFGVCYNIIIKAFPHRADVQGKFFIALVTNCYWHYCIIKQNRSQVRADERGYKFHLVK